MRTGWAWLLLTLSAAGCLEDRLEVQVVTRVRPDGSCHRQLNYRLERVDPEKADARLPIPPAENALAVRHQFPKGEAWRVERTQADDASIVDVQGDLPPPCPVDGDYSRVAAPGAPPSRNSGFLAVDVSPRATTYDWGEVFRDPVSPLAAARRLAAALAARDEAFASAFEHSLERRLDRGALRAAYRRAFSEPFTRRVGLLTQAPARPGFREAKDVGDLLDDSLLERELVAALAALPEDISADDAQRGVDAALEELQPGIEADLAAAGFPLDAALPELKDPRQRIHFTVRLVMPAPIVRANACVQGDSVSWEFDEADLYGAGFQMWARATAP